jgi:hypothetical protein
MSSSFGKRKPVVRPSEQPQRLRWLTTMKPTGADASAAETVEALYRITQSAPSRLSLARSTRAQYRTAA